MIKQGKNCARHTGRLVTSVRIMVILLICALCTVKKKDAKSNAMTTVQEEDKSTGMFSFIQRPKLKKIAKPVSKFKTRRIFFKFWPQIQYC